MDYAELHCHSHYSFLNGTSSPAALAERAAAHGLKGLALTDDNALYGVIPFVKKCKAIGLEYIIGSLITVGPQTAVLTLMTRFCCCAKI